MRKCKIEMRVIILFVLILGLQNIVRADTIDYWHVYYNKIKIKEYNVNSIGTIMLKVRNIKKKDSLIIKYFKDTPCYDCESHVIVENTKHTTVMRSRGKGTFNPIRISLYDLLRYRRQTRESTYEVLFYEDRLVGEEKKMPIFKIKLE